MIKLLFISFFLVYCNGIIYSQEESICDSIYSFETNDIINFIEPTYKSDGDFIKFVQSHIMPIISEHGGQMEEPPSKLYFSILINEKGDVVEVKTVKAQLSEGFERALMEEFMKMEQWSPATINHLPVCFKLNLPISCIMWE